RHRPREDAEPRRRFCVRRPGLLAREDAEPLEHDAARSRRREGDDGAPTKRADEGLAPLGPVRGEGGGVGDAAPAPHRGHQRGSHRTAVEGGGSMPGDVLQRAREISLHDPEAGTGWLAVLGEEDRTQARVGGEQVALPLDLLAEVWRIVEREAVAGEPDGGREDVGEREPPEGGVERLPARDLARYADGEPAAPQSLGPWLSVVVEPVGRGGSGRSFPEVEREGLTAGEPDH